jgi:dTDP-4-dehydrorhamnose reductase
LGKSAVGTYHERPRPGLVQLDIRDSRGVVEFLLRTKPDVIFFPAANANVDWCERNPAAAEETNLRPMQAITQATAGPSIVAYSSDYVFDGRDGPYIESNLVSPMSVYGKLKAQLEQLVLEAGGIVIRSTGIFGWESPPPKNFVLRLIASMSRGERSRLPNDQIATPTYVDDLAAGSVALAAAQARGLWHLAGPDLVSRAAFGRMVADTFGLNDRLIEEVPTASLAQAAPRPLKGGLLCPRFAKEFGRPPARGLHAALLDLRTQMRLSA